MANTTNNVNTQTQNPMKVITGPDTRWSYANDITDTTAIPTAINATAERGNK